MKKQSQNYTYGEPVRKLSFFRLLFVMVVISGIIFSGFNGLQNIQASRYNVSHEPWFAPYVDVTSTPKFNFEQLGKTPNKDVMLSFIVSHQNDGCMPAWGAAYTLDGASDTLDLERRIERLKQQGGDIAISFGGLANKELAVGCDDDYKLLKAYKQVVDRYQVDTIDLDLEKLGLTDTDAGARRAKAIATLQSEQRAKGKPLAVWVTLPVAPQGLTEDGTKAIELLLAGKVDITGVNVMTMDYGSSKLDGQSMIKASESALNETHRQLSILYDRANLHLNSGTVWAKLGATPMIGQNDVKGEVFRIKDAQQLNDFARSHHMGRMSMWSANRDIPCGDNYVDIRVVSNSCSGVTQDKYGFITALSKDFSGNIASNAGVITKADRADNAAQKADDPATSPYQIWSEDGSYLAGTKVVWHHNVYQAKWWTQGDMPDNPVLQSWQTPWTLVGPVLAGEKPIKQETLPAGTYPEWSGNQSYESSQRVLFNGVPFQAKWWNEGQSPAAAASNPNGSPWVPLTQAQINAVLAER